MRNFFVLILCCMLFGCAGNSSNHADVAGNIDITSLSKQEIPIHNQDILDQINCYLKDGCDVQKDTLNNLAAMVEGWNYDHKTTSKQKKDIIDTVNIIAYHKIENSGYSDAEIKPFLATRIGDIYFSKKKEELRINIHQKGDGESYSGNNIVKGPASNSCFKY